MNMMILDHDRSKRILELITVPVLILALLPVMLVVGATVALSMGFPIFYRGRRVGKDERLFTQLKFRTMTTDVDTSGVPLPDILRLKRTGRILRAASLDELPQLFNILKGDMSFVGPRPLLPSYLPRYSVEQRRRHLVRPGLTGLAQVTGRNNLDWATRFGADIDYVDRASFRLDLYIILRSVQTVLLARGIHATTSTESTYIGAEEFMGDHAKEDLSAKAS